MAEGIVVEGKSLEELEREITCGICQEHYTEPKALPCLHYYCKQCILRLVLRTGTGKPFSCPECRCEATLPEGGVDELKTSFFVNRLMTTISTMERAHGKVEAKCELCSDSGDKAEAFCRQCAMFICKECIKQHTRMKPFVTHDVASLEDLKLGRSKPIVIKEPPTKKCLDHDEPLNIYCYDCCTLICRDCTVKDHKEHNFEFCKKAAPTTKKKLLEELKPLKEQSVNFSHAVKEIQTIKNEVEEQGDSVANTIQTSFKELRDILDKREKELLNDCGRVVREKVEKLLLQEKNLSLASAEVQSVVDYTEQCVRHCTDNEVMSMHAEIRRRIEREIDERSKSGRSLEPVEEADMGVEVRCAEALQQLYETQANIIQLRIDPAKCTVTMEVDNIPEVNKLCGATLAVRLTNNQLTNRNCEITSQIKSLYNGGITDCKVSSAGSGQYYMKYTPTLRGRHELTVSVDGQQVAGNPFPAFVSIHPTQLGKPVKVWNDLYIPLGITVNSSREILFTEYNRNIIKITLDKQVKTLVVQQELQDIRGITVDCEDNIYCTSIDTSKILRSDRDGGNVQVKEVKQVNGRGYYNVAVIGDEVMMCEANCTGTIVVFDKQLNYLRHIEQKRAGLLAGIASDNYGNVYTTDNTNKCIRVFSNDGVLLRSFGQDENGVKKLSGPWGICVSGQYVYVVNYTSQSVSVFTTDGVYVSSFGQRGHKEGEFNGPLYLCVDQDGFIYVVDTHNSRVQCF